MVLLGDGWYAGFADGLTREHFENRPELRVQLEIEGQPNEQLVVDSDAQWEWRPSPLLHADLSVSSAIDGRAFGHDPEYARQKRLWLPVDVIERPARELFPVSGRGVVSGQTVSGKLERRADLVTGERRWWVEFPQTVLGRVSLTLHGQSGRYLRIRYSTTTDERDQPIFSASPNDTYTLSGDHPREVIAAPFARCAFRRIEITGDIESRELLSVEAIPLGIAMATTLQLQSDHPGITQLLPRLSRTLDLLCQEVIWSGVVVDARHVNFAQLYPLVGIVAMTRDLGAHFREWLEEVLASEADPAGLPAQLPRLRSLQATTGISAAAGLSPEGSDDSSCSETVVKLCLELFQQSGDRAVLERVFPFARRLVYSLEKTFPELIRPLAGFKNQRAAHTSQMLGTALWYECITDTARIAELLELNTHPLLGARILDVLSSGGRDDLAWAVALRLGSNSWLGQIDRAGQADDVLRDVDGEISLHQAVLVGWLVTTAAGLKLDVALHGEGSGWQKALIAPRVPVGELFPEGPPLKFLHVTMQAAAGLWRVEWQVTAQELMVQTRVPVGCVAMVQMPDGVLVRQVAGEHLCRIDLKVADDQIPILSETL